MKHPIESWRQNHTAWSEDQWEFEQRQSPRIIRPEEWNEVLQECLEQDRLHEQELKATNK